MVKINTIQELIDHLKIFNAQTEIDETMLENVVAVRKMLKNAWKEGHWTRDV